MKPSEPRRKIVAGSRVHQNAGLAITKPLNSISAKLPEYNSWRPIGKCYHDFKKAKANRTTDFTEGTETNFLSVFFREIISVSREISGFDPFSEYFALNHVETE
jgi:hypothetical protein